MSFFKNLGETVKDTASTIGAKSKDVLEIGKLKLQRNKLESVIKDKKFEIGDTVYEDHKRNAAPDTDKLIKIFDEIQDIENQISELDEKIKQL